MTVEYTNESSGAVLKISSVQGEDEATYKCEITYLEVIENCDVVQIVKLKTLRLQESLKVNCSVSVKADLTNELFTKFRPSVADIVLSFEQLLEDNFYDGDILQREFVAKWGPKWQIMMQKIHSESDDAMDIYAPNVETNNKFQVLAELEKEVQDQQEETVKSVEKPQSIQVMDQNTSPTNKPPPIFIRDKKTWPTTCQYLKNHAAEYDECKSILDKNKIQYHTFKKIENREIRAISKGVAEELDTTSITNELIERGFNPRVVARFKNKNGNNMPIILVIVPDTDHKIKEVNQICEMEVRFEPQRPRKRVGQCYNCQKFGHNAYNCNADPVCRHCAGSHESRQHIQEAETPNKCGNCGGPHKSNYRGCPKFSISEKKERPPLPRHTRPIRNTGKEKTQKYQKTRRLRNY
ncbi:hypothetical protein JTB14_034333 [Gonioctena quinquepunctata]|nr:hypothetical protein JTB14_034333 [Gonioctena quinquepunctata]